MITSFVLSRDFNYLSSSLNITLSHLIKFLSLCDKFLSLSLLITFVFLHESELKLVFLKQRVSWNQEQKRNSRRRRLRQRM